MRRAKFVVTGRFDGEPTATVTIEYQNDRLAVLRVRPRRRHRTFDANLADIAQGVIYDVVKREVAEKRRLKKGKR